MKLLISAGGTGGHIFPGIAAAEAFLEKDTGNTVVFTGTHYGLENKIIPSSGFRLLYVEARQFSGRSPLYKIATVMYLVRGVISALGIIRKEKPDAILGMGGFTSVPVVIAGKLLGTPLFLHEQNVDPGLANKFLCTFARTTFVSFEETRNYLKTEHTLHTGNPLRKTVKRSDAKRQEGVFTIFVFGGSRGARSINQSILALLPYLESYKNIVMYHQTGPADFDEVHAAYAKTTIKHEVFPFTDDMARYYTLADLVISRAGASTIFELARFKRAAILIPYPFSAGMHQWKNASYVEKIGGGYVIGNDEATAERLIEVIRHLMSEPGLIWDMGENIGKIYVDDAADRIANEITRSVCHGIP